MPGRSSLLLLLLVVVSTASAQQVTFGPRIGGDLDSLERSYFGLFPREKEFARADAVRRGDSIAVGVHRHTGDTTYTLSRPAFDELIRMIGIYEELFEYTDISDQMLWAELGRVIQPTSPRKSGKGTRVYYRRAEDPLVSGLAVGQVVAANDSVLLLWTGKGRFNPTVRDSSLRQIHLSAIIGIDQGMEDLDHYIGLGLGFTVEALTLVTYEPSRSAFGLESGVAALGAAYFTYSIVEATGIGVPLARVFGSTRNDIGRDQWKYSQLLDQLRSGSVFPGPLPPEVDLLLAHPTRLEYGPRIIPADDAGEAEPTHSWIRLTVGVPLLADAPSSAGGVLTVDRRPVLNDSITHGVPVRQGIEDWHLGLDLAPIDRLWIGGDVRWYPSTAATDSAANTMIQGNSIGLHVGYTPLRIGSVRDEKRIEITVEAGVVMTSWKAWTMLAPANPRTFDSANATQMYSGSGSSTAPLLGLRLDWHLTSWMSSTLLAQWRNSPDIIIPASSNPELPTFSIAEHQSTPQRLSLVLGFSITPF